MRKRNKKGQFIKGQKPIEHRKECNCFRCGGEIWNKGLAWDEKTKRKISRSKKGVRIWGGKRDGMDWMQGKRHHAWKGDEVGYDALHGWVERELGRSDICEHCGSNGLSGRYIHWASKSRGYKRDLKDWLRLCSRCHYKYDDIGAKMWAARKGKKYNGKVPKMSKKKSNKR